MVQVKGTGQDKKHGFKKFIDKTLGSLMQPKIRRKIATDIREIKGRVMEVYERRSRYEQVNHISVDKPVKVDPRALVRYEDVRKLVGIDEARDEVLKLLNDGDAVSKQPKEVVSIVGFGGLGKTTLANVVYEKIKGRFDCSAFVSVSQTPDMDKLFKDMFYQLANYSTASINVIDELREFLRDKRYFIIIDDVWDIKSWHTIRCALPNNSDGYRIITTTRNLNVAEQIGGVYEMKPLSPENSRVLMYGRIFKDKHKCPDEQLAEVSDKILSKCGGVPLAIITIASLLANKGGNKLEWFDVCNSIGTGLQENNTLDNMRNVLSLSYYDMPSHLRSCLLYLCMFPEDYEIEKHQLIWLWIAEGFIQSGKQEKRLFEIGESYFNELINRSMVQPKYDIYTHKVEYCHVHDMVLDLICFLSSKENFVTIKNGVDHPLSTAVRRLSLQNGKAGHEKPKPTMILEHVRSIIAFPPTMDHVLTLLSSKVLRVLDLYGCDLSESYSLKYLENLLHLRYLGLRYTKINQLPEEIGNLRYLRTLDAWGNKIYKLPSTIVLLRNLMYLCIDDPVVMPKSFGSLTTLEELLVLGIDNDSAYNIVQELGHLTKLRLLSVFIRSGTEWNESLNTSLVESLNKLHKVQTLTLWDENLRSDEGVSLDGWVTPQHLRELSLPGCLFSTLPAWVDPSRLLDLSILIISLRVLQPEDLEILGRLPALAHLGLRVDHENLGIHREFTVAACLFPCLLSCKLRGFGGLVVFEQGAMPRLARLQVEFVVQEMRVFNGGFDLGLGNLPSLDKIIIWFGSKGASKEEVKEAEAEVRHAIEAHPNHPTLNFYCL